MKNRLPKKNDGECVDMCKAIEDMRNESKAEGRAEGRADRNAEIEKNLRGMGMSEEQIKQALK